jgi:hypothetical protein
LEEDPRTYNLRSHMAQFLPFGKTLDVPPQNKLNCAFRPSS